MTTSALTEIQICGFKCLTDLRFAPSADRTVLVGRNGSGKSSVLDAVALVGDLIKLGPAAFDGDRRGNLGGSRLGEIELVSAFGGDRRIAIALGFRIRGSDFRYRIALEPARGAWQVVEEELLGPAKGEGRQILLHRDQRGARVYRREGDRAGLVPIGQQWNLTVLNACADPIQYPDILPAWQFLTGICMLRLTPVLMRRPWNLADAATGSPFPDSYGRDLTARLHRFMTTRPELLSDFLTFMGDFVGWTHLATPAAGGSVSPTFREGVAAAPLSLMAASDGTVVEAYLAALGLDPPEGVSVYLFDEPAAAFFGDSLERPAELIKTLSASHQVLVATHAQGLIGELGDQERAWLLWRRPGEAARIRKLGDLPGVDDDIADGGGFSKVALLRAGSEGGDR